MTRDVFVTGATGYLGRALLRAGAESRLPAGVPYVVGDALRAASYAAHVAPCDTLVQLVGVAHPSPSKAAEFDRVDRASGLAALDAAATAGARHLVYVSVAQPAPVMRAYVAARAAVEGAIHARHAAGGPAATILRPWYVLGPGHRWAYALQPLYALGRLLPTTRDGAERLGLVTHRQMVAALVHAVEHPPAGIAIVDVPAIRRAVRF